ncbi:unnamed protein product [Prunus armeniaca]|uniref:Uncharacterized protein n=1 Tax=Prunus armeniaca TaxID=36596 RepID=A0A6J5URF4_PRUAR|nr:unnamed protein product [Prunus armeniaca]
MNGRARGGRKLRSRATHSQEMPSGYGISRRLAVLHLKLDQLHCRKAEEAEKENGEINGDWGWRRIPS